MKTRLTEARLVELRAAAKETAAASGPFVDPAMVMLCTRVLDGRGEEWAASVLGRDVSRRSIAVPRRPWLLAGEEYALVEADVEEDKLMLREMEEL